MITRILYKTIARKLSSGKAIILLGARQTGKTTLLKLLFEKDEKALWLNADEADTLAIFEEASSVRLKAIFKGYSTLIVDEAQRIKNVGLKFKLITDQIPSLQLIATGSSAFELANKINEPLTGRKFEYSLFPISFEELKRHHGLFFVDSSMILCQEINSNGAFRFVVILLLIQFFNLLIQFFSFFFQGLVELLSILQYLDRNQTLISSEKNYPTSELGLKCRKKRES